MDIKTFYKTQSEIADTINKLIDSYWNDEIKEEMLIDSIKKISQNNECIFRRIRTAIPEASGQ